MAESNKPASNKSPAVHISLSLPLSLFTAIEALAAEQTPRITRSEWIREACRRAVHEWALRRNTPEETGK